MNKHFSVTRLIAKALLITALLPFTTVAQQPEDKGEFVPYKNDFYSKIKKELTEHEQEQGTNRKFQTDVSGMDLPQSVEEFTTVWCQDPISQGRTGTCWCFSTSSFYESEIHRITGKEVKLSELYIVYWEYVAKAREYVNTRGTSFFGEGSEANAVTRMMADHGLVPLEAYSGMKNGVPFHDHAAMFDEMSHYLETLKRDNAWNEEAAITTVRAILDHYIGQPPTSFTYQGASYEPIQFMDEVAKLKPNDYVNFMSLMEKPYFESAEYNVPDNWWNSDDYYNVPLDTYMGLIKKALKNGYSLAIGGDVSETGYVSDYDVAIVPSYDIPSEHINEYSRQLRFSNGSTTDDHAIHLIGYLEEGDDFWFLIKDSGSGARNGKNEGYYFYHEDYVKLKMMNVTVHKDAVRDVLKQIN